MTLAEYSIRRPVFAWMLMAALIVFGAISLGRLGISMMPDVDFPVLQVSVSWPGAAPEIVESELVDQIEQRVMGVEGLKGVRSTVMQGQGNVELEFDIDRDIDAALQEVQGSISRLRLPLGVDAPTIRKNSTEADPIMFMGVTGPQPPRELVAFVENYLQDQFQLLPGVGEVMVGGFSDRNLRLWVDNDKLKRYELTVSDLQKAVELQHVEMAAGSIENDKREVNVRTMGEGLTPEQVGDILVTQRGGQQIHDSAIRIRDIARVEDGLNDIRRISRMNGVDSVNIGIRKQRGANEVRVAKGVRAKIAEIVPTLPPGMKLELNMDATRFVEQSVRQTEEDLLLAALLTALICYLFLGNWTSGLNIILAIPTSVIGSFLVLYFMGFTLNMFTLLGLALAIGIVVDDAIMMLENIVRHLHMGKHRVAASRDGSREITFAAVAATLAVVAIFLPVVFMKGVIGRFFFQFGVTITAAVALSLLEAVTLTPMRCSQFLAVSGRPGLVERNSARVFGAIARSYRQVLEWALPRRRWVLIAAACLFAASLYSARFLRREFVPPQDQNFLRVSLRTPVGSSLPLTDGYVRQVEDIIRARPEVARTFSFVGGFNGIANQASIMVTLVDKKDRKLGQAEVQKVLREELSKFKNLRITFGDMSGRGLTARRNVPVEFSIAGDDLGALEKASREIMDGMEASGLMTDVDSNYRAGMPELRVIPDREKAAARGVPIAAVNEAINAAIGGVREGKFSSGGRRYDIRIRLNPEERASADDIGRLQVRTAYGELVALSELVRFEEAATVQTITRVNRQRAIEINANLAPGASQAAAIDTAGKIARKHLPPGYVYKLQGSSQTFKESFGTLWVAFVLGIAAAYMILASQFNSFLDPLTVLLALPFSISGACWALLATGQSLNLYSAIGVILLMGIVKKNSILLVEFTNQIEEKKKLPLHEALLEACPIRLRPILMTSLSTIVAALPLALGFGPGAETRRPMAVAVVGGVVVSTVFTLLVVPCAHILMARLRRRPAHDAG